MGAGETEVAMLGIDGRLVADRAVLEVEYQPCGDALAMRDLDEITIGESFSRRRAQHKKTMDSNPPCSERRLDRQHWRRLEQGSAGYKSRERAPTTF
jgi:hypothetical protein